jgi:PKD repeat protein
MKKIITTALAITAGIVVNAQTQIGNSGFENWESVTGGSEPVNWNSFLTASGSLNGQAENQLQESTDVRAGATGKSVRLNARSVFGFIANGNITLGQVNMGHISPSNANNHNATRRSDLAHSEVMTEKPDSIAFWVKFTPAGSHNGEARMKATIHDDNDYRDPENTASQGYVVGTAVINFSSTGGQWVRKSVPFNYNGPANDPRFILVTFTTNKTAGSGAHNDYLWVDDVELIYVPKPSFTASAIDGCEGTTINFTNTSGHYPTSYEWSFPGGNPSISTDANPSVTYSTAGIYDVVLTATNQWGSKTTTFTNHIEIEACAGIKNDAKVISSLEVYPNPTDGILTVSDITKNTPYTIISMSGAIITKGELSVSSNKIDLSEIQNGFYLLHLQEEQNTRIISVIKK